MFIVEVAAAFTTVLALIDPSVFAWLITAWLWLTVLFANLAESVAEDRGKAQAATLRRAKQDTVARRLIGWSVGAASGTYREEAVDAVALQQGDIVVVEAGQIIAGDGDVVEGIATVDESAITGESAPVIRESAGIARRSPAEPECCLPGWIGWHSAMCLPCRARQWKRLVM